MTVNVPKRWSDFDVANNVSANDYFLVTNSQTGNTARVNMLVIGNYLTTVSTSRWGQISGNIASQTDLITILNTKANTSSLSTVAFSGSYTDLSNKPTILTNPMTASSSLIVGGVSGAPTELKITGALSGWVPTFNGTNVVWAAPAGSLYVSYSDSGDSFPSLVPGSDNFAACSGSVVGNNTFSAIVLGYHAIVGDNATNGIAFGTSAVCNAGSAISIGSSATVDVASINGIAFGIQSHSIHVNSIAFGTQVATTQDNQLAIGKPTRLTTISFVAAGVNPTDAVNVGQITPATSISTTPTSIGLFAVVAGIGYMSTGTASTADWKQITN